jgi:excisionase family DNA binding protein
MTEKYLTIREVAGMLSVSYQTIWGMVKRGELDSIRIRSAVRIPESALVGLGREKPVRPVKP